MQEDDLNPQDLNADNAAASIDPAQNVAVDSPEQQQRRCCPCFFPRQLSGVSKKTQTTKTTRDSSARSTTAGAEETETGAAADTSSHEEMINALLATVSSTRRIPPPPPPAALEVEWHPSDDDDSLIDMQVGDTTQSLASSFWGTIVEPGTELPLSKASSSQASSAQAVQECRRKSDSPPQNLQTEVDQIVQQTLDSVQRRRRMLQRPPDVIWIVPESNQRIEGSERTRRRENIRGDGSSQGKYFL